MKYLLSFIASILMFNTISFTQPDSLRKYSYHIYGVRVDSTVIQEAGGSGYFVRNNNKIFFVTANHVITGCEAKDTCQPSQKPKTFPSEMNIFLTNFDGTLSFKPIPVSVGYLQVILPCTDAGLLPDIASYELRSTPKETIYSIENFLDTPLPTDIGEISIYGYPSSATYTPYGKVLASSTNLLLNDFSFFEFYNYKACGGVMAIDSINYIVKPKDSIENNLFGFSGSPAFIKNKKDRQWHFIGTFVGSVENDKYMFVKPFFTNKVIGVKR